MRTEIDRNTASAEKAISSEEAVKERIDNLDIQLSQALHDGGDTLSESLGDELLPQLQGLSDNDARWPDDAFAKDVAALQTLYTIADCVVDSMKHSADRLAVDGLEATLAPYLVGAARAQTFETLRVSVSGSLALAKTLRPSDFALRYGHYCHAPYSRTTTSVELTDRETGMKTTPVTLELSCDKARLARNIRTGILAAIGAAILVLILSHH